MNKRIFLTIFLSATAFGQSDLGKWKCGAGELRFQEKGAVNTVSAKYCHRTQPDQLLSQNCHDGKCELLEKIKKATDADFEVPVSTVGNPGFRLCRKLGGLPRVIEFKVDKAWKAFNECRFAKDDSFANVDFLLYAAKRERSWL